MSDEILEKLVKSYMSTDQQTYSFGWQGGEPTLMGVDFFREVISLQKKYGRSGAVVANGLQTNATLIDDDLAAHLARYNFLLGCSLDGPAGIHDRYRLTAGGIPTHQSVINGIETLKRYGVQFNIIVLVTQANVTRAREVYQYFKNSGYFFQQYIPCVEFDAKGNLLPFAITAEQWGEFLCSIFDEWYPQDFDRVSIRHFDSILEKMLEGTDNVCTLGRNCCQYFVVEYNGDVYPCDFFVRNDLKIGNIMDTTWEEALASCHYQEFGAQKARWNPACERCDCLTLCSGDCLKHRTYAGNEPQNLSWLCAGWKKFLRHTQDRFQKIAVLINSRRLQMTQSDSGTSN